MTRIMAGAVKIKGGPPVDGAAPAYSASSQLRYNSCSPGAKLAAADADYNTLDAEAVALRHHTAGSNMRSTLAQGHQEAVLLRQRLLRACRQEEEEEEVLERQAPCGGLVRGQELEESEEEEESWEVRAFAEDVSRSTANAGAMMWPPRSYSCAFCRREFRSAQALGGHMNVHRRDRARLRRSPPAPPSPSPAAAAPSPRPATTAPPPGNNMPYNNSLYPSLRTLLHNLSYAAATSPPNLAISAPANHVMITTTAPAAAHSAISCSPNNNHNRTDHADATAGAAKYSSASNPLLYCSLLYPFALPAASGLPSPTRSTSSSPTAAPGASSSTSTPSAMSCSSPSLTRALNFPSPVPSRPGAAPPAPPDLNLLSTSLPLFLNPPSNRCTTSPSCTTSSSRSSWISHEGRCSSIANSSDVHSTILHKSPRPIKRLQTGAFQPYQTIKVLQKTSCTDSNTATFNISRHDNPPEFVVVPHGATALDLELRLGQ